MSKPDNARDIIFSLQDRFKASDENQDLDITFHFKISGDNGGDYTVNIEDNECKVTEGLEGEPKCVVKCKDSVYTDIELGKTNAQMAFMMGKIKISNIGAMLKFIDNFERIA